MKFEIGINSITSYKRLAYTPWYAIAEFVDNATQSYLDNEEALMGAVEKGAPTPLTVRIDYQVRSDGVPGKLVIKDNAMGMSLSDLEYAMHVARPPSSTSGRCKYGMGLKTAACWMGNSWTVTTKKLGDPIEYRLAVDVDRIAAGNNDLVVEKNNDVHVDDHYTIVEITDHNQRFFTRTINKITTYLSSIYRQDFRDEWLTLRWRDRVLQWELDDDDRILKSATSGDEFRKPIKFSFMSDDNIKRHVSGWVGILKEGSRRHAGFSIFQANRVIKGYPEGWRPYLLFGEDEPNDVVNQRLFGEIHLDGFEVSHTKDHIVWLGDEEEQVNKGLRKDCWNYREFARNFRHPTDDQIGPTEAQVLAAIDHLKRELGSNQLRLWSERDLDLTNEIITELKRVYVDYVVKNIRETFHVHISEDLAVRGFVVSMSPFEPYLAIERAKPGQLDIIVNKSHLHWNQIEGEAGVLNFLRHCVYDGIAESRALDQEALSMRIYPDTIKMLKDNLLRLPLEIERAEQETDVNDKDEIDDLE